MRRTNAIKVFIVAMARIWSHKIYPHSIYMLELFATEGKKFFERFPGGCGRRSRYLANAKRALYNLS